jgi:putative phosphoribosyl transferase
MRFKNRMEAGTLLAQRLASYAERSDVIVLALPRGGVPVGFALAQVLRVPLDILLVRKLGVPGHEELAMGAIASGGMKVLNEEVVAKLDIDPGVIEAISRREMLEIDRREKLYRDGSPAPTLTGRTVILVDDGLATGATMRVALRAARQGNPARIIIATPVAAPESCEELRKEADDIICHFTPKPFYAVGLWYEDFPQTTDIEVKALLAEARRRQGSSTDHIVER